MPDVPSLLSHYSLGITAPRSLGKMKGVILVGFLVFCCLAVGEGLECYSCEYPCLIKTKVTCGLLETCDTRVASKGAATLTAKGCLNPTRCLTTETNSIVNIEYTVTHSCCLGELCNSGTAIKLSLLAGLSTLVPLLLMKLL